MQPRLIDLHLISLVALCSQVAAQPDQRDETQVAETGLHHLISSVARFVALCSQPWVEAIDVLGGLKRLQVRIKPVLSVHLHVDVCNTCG